jgi:hypothetical protein
MRILIQPEACAAVVSVLLLPAAGLVAASTVCATMVHVLTNGKLSLLLLPGECKQDCGCILECIWYSCVAQAWRVTTRPWQRIMCFPYCCLQ